MQFTPRSWRLSAAFLTAVTFAPYAAAQQLFVSPEAAATAFVEAVRADDHKMAKAVLGPGGQEILSSGDEMQDATVRQLFLMAYDTTHKINAIGNDRAMLSVGEQGFVLPIPILKREKGWMFDAAAGREEILFRRIGRNELSTIQVCLAYVDAQREYANLMKAGGAPAAYAQRFVSSSGKKDGLYWPQASGGEASPMGEFVAMATMEGYRLAKKPQPFHGYYYKILTRQAATAPGGAADYVVDGHMIGGFALVAFPAEYGNSGVVTFLVNHDGTVFQKDLGARTSIAAERMTAFSPDHTWAKVQAAELLPQ
jgi:hypothetical protein